MAKLTGYEAITYAEKNEMTLNKYNDPIEAARSRIDPTEARDIAGEDPSLIWLYEIGTRVEGGGAGEDHDVGKIAGPASVGECDVMVSWESGVRTPAISWDLAEAL